MDHAVNAEPAYPGKEPSKKGGLARREIRTCPTCGTKFSAMSDSGMCPVCILLGSVGEESAVVESPIQASGSERDAAKTEHLSIVRRFENYEVMLDEDGTPVELGRGAMGVTYKAFDVDLRCPVTLKVISERYLGDESASIRFLREARAAASVRHPNVASVLHLGRTGSSYFYAMEFVQGETLESLIKRSSRLEVTLALEIATQVAAGLAAVHKQNLVHRDIKPSNIMVNLEGGGAVTAKIIDLGLAKSVNEPGSQTAISTPGAFAGTPEFASPEQFAGVSVDIRSDLYSLGVVLWEMVTGDVVFRGSPAEVMYQHQHTPLPVEQLEAVPQPVVVLLDILLEKDPAQRFRTPNELLNVIPAVMRAVEARRTIEHQKLRANFVRKSSSRPKKLPSIRVPKRSIAVLPFASLSNDKKNAYFADGVQDEILSHLAKVSQLKVISRTSVMTYHPGGNRDLRSIASALGVAHVVEGTVRRDVNRVRITIRLVGALTDETLWSETYDRDLTDIFAIQSDIAKTVAAKLSAQLSPKERKDIEEKPTKNLEAYDLYLQAKERIAAGWMDLVNKEDLLKAIDLLERATRKDAQFALGYCLIARANDYLYFWGFDKTPERRVLGDLAVKEALRLRPDLAEAHLAEAHHLYRCYKDHERASVQLAIAEQTLPNSPEILACRASIDRRQGHWDDSIKLLEYAIRLDPRNPRYLGFLADNYECLRRYQEYEKTQDRLIALMPDKMILKLEKAYVAFTERGSDVTTYRAALNALPASMKDDEFANMLLFNMAICARDWTHAKEIFSHCHNDEVYFLSDFTRVPRGCLNIWLTRLQGDPSGSKVGMAPARDELKRKIEAHPDDAFLLSGLGLIDAVLGRKEEAIEEAKRAVEMTQDARDGPGFASSLAIVYAWTHELDLALQELAISIKTPAGVAYGNLKRHPCWDPLRTDPRFEKILAELAPKE